MTHTNTLLYIDVTRAMRNISCKLEWHVDHVHFLRCSLRIRPEQHTLSRAVYPSARQPAQVHESSAAVDQAVEELRIDLSLIRHGNRNRSYHLHAGNRAMINTSDPDLAEISTKDVCIHYSEHKEVWNSWSGIRSGEFVDPECRECVEKMLKHNDRTD